MPTAPGIDRDGWRKIDERAETVFSSPLMTVEASSAVYDRPEFYETLEPVVPEDLGQSPRTVFTTALSFSPSLPGSAERLLGVLGGRASSEFAKSLEADGLVNVEQTGTEDLELADRTVKAFQYHAGYPLDAAAFERDVTPLLPVRVWAALWPADGSFEMGGGGYPLADIAEAIDGTVDLPVTATANPEQDRRELFDCIAEAVS